MTENEMIKDICPDYGTMCDKCNANGHCSVEYTVKRLINKNYRKIADDEIVIKNSEYKDLRLAKYKAMAEAIEYEKTAYKKLETAKQETAREVINKLLEKINALISMGKKYYAIESNDAYFLNVYVLLNEIEQLAKEYGVDLE